MKIYLVSAPSENAFNETFLKKILKPWYFKERSYPVGIAYLGTILEKKGHDVRLFDFFNKPQNQIETEFLDIINQEKPDVVGFSILSMNRVASFDLIKKIKEKHPEIKIIAGGIHCSVLYEQILRNFPVDAICVTEGESLIHALVENINNKDALKSVPGLAFIDKNNELVLTNPPEPIKDLDMLPFPKHEAFLNPKSKNAFVITSRGCVGQCIFCSTKAYWKTWRGRSAKNVVDEIEQIKKQFPNIKNIFVHDDTFTLDNNRVIDICKEILQRKIKINWICSARVHPISLEMLSWMKKAGCQKMIFGIESGSEKMLTSMKKFITREQIITAFKLTKQAGIKADAYLLVGLPSESDETLNETIDLLDKIGLAATASAAILELYPNTEIYRTAKAQGFITDDYWLTNKKIPLYTYEHSLSKLTKMKFRLTYESIRNKSYLLLLLFGLKKIIFEPKLAYNNIKAMFSK